MEFYIKKNSTLPLLLMQVVKDGRSDYDSFMNLLEVSSVFFSMVDIETGIPKITSRPAGIVNKTFEDPNAEPEYYIYYQFTPRETNKVGRFEGQFMVRTPDGVLILPIREKLYVNVQDSFVADDLPYESCYVTEFPCCINGPFTTTTTTECCPCTSTTTISPTTTSTTPSPITTTTTILVGFDYNEIQLTREHKEDVRDNNYLINNFLQSSNRITNPRITSRFWDDNGWWGNQGNTPQCVGYAWAHWLEDGPVGQSGIAPIIQPKIIYEQAQKLDEWPGENYQGTSVRGGVKALQIAGKVRSYYWGFDLNSLINAVLYYGPVVVGTYWYYNMFFPNQKGFITPTGRIMGGHAYVINGVDTNRQYLRIKNSWGRGWGINGSAYMSLTDMSKLIRQNGEVCIATEIGS